MKKSISYVGFLILLVSTSCVTYHPPEQQTGSKAENKYSSSFPSRNISQNLEQIQRSVRRISSTAIYETYYMEAPNVLVQDLNAAKLKDLASHKTSADQSKAGTAVSIFQNNRHTALVTAHHILFFPDTVITYRKGENIPSNKFIKSVSVKKKQRDYLITNSEVIEIKVVAEDPVHDIALIATPNAEERIQAIPLRIRIGRAKSLQLGSFLYILGFPLGSPMVTRGIVSAPDYDGRGSFLTDALFNHGISGGLIIASRDNFRNFEWVGMAVTAAASDQEMLIPDPSKVETYKDNELYTDSVFVSRKQVINYGVTAATPIEQIITFLISNEDELNRLGFSVKNISK